MKIAVIATTQGAGATFVSTNLATVSGFTYADFNNPPFGNQLLQAQITGEQKVYLSVKKESDENGADVISEEILFAPQENATEIATLFSGANADKVKVIYANGAPEYINQTANAINAYAGEANLIMDCPNATTSTALKCLSYCDYCIIVVEPGVYDFENFKSLIRLCKLVNKPYGLIINKFVTPYNKLTDYCNLHSTEVLAKIPLTKREEKIISSGEIISKVKFTYKQYFSTAIQTIKRKVKK